MLLDEETADELKKNQLKSILTSLTSFDKETHDKITGRSGNFQKVIKGIQLALEKNIKVGVNMVLTKINKDHVYETGKFVHNL
jgi:MoaA/NifB/PqqE/SkfB family radical SAM enzyme